MFLILTATVLSIWVKSCRGSTTSLRDLLVSYLDAPRVIFLERKSVVKPTTIDQGWPSLGGMEFTSCPTLLIGTILRDIL